MNSIQPRSTTPSDDPSASRLLTGPACGVCARPVRPPCTPLELFLSDTLLCQCGAPLPAPLGAALAAFQIDWREPAWALRPVEPASAFLRPILVARRDDPGPPVNIWLVHMQTNSVLSILRGKVSGAKRAHAEAICDRLADALGGATSLGQAQTFSVSRRKVRSA